MTHHWTCQVIYPKKECDQQISQFGSDTSESLLLVETCFFAGFGITAHWPEFTADFFGHLAASSSSWNLEKIQDLLATVMASFLPPPTASILHHLPFKLAHFLSIVLLWDILVSCPILEFFDVLLVPATRTTHFRWFISNKACYYSQWAICPHEFPQILISAALVIHWRAKMASLTRTLQSVASAFTASFDVLLNPFF